MKNIRKKFGMATVAGALSLCTYGAGYRHCECEQRCELGRRRGVRVVATGPSTPVTATTAACSSPWAPGVPMVVGFAPYRQPLGADPRGQQCAETQGIGAWPSCGGRG